jgi:hypothetical protein
LSRNLPDPDLHLRESCDFVLNSRLGRLALQYPGIPGLAVFLRDLLEVIHRLAQSCHMPEFTDHALSHVCSLVDRISEWTCAAQESGTEHLCDLITSEEAALLLLATIVHDIGMLSRNPEDLPEGNRGDFDLEFQDIQYWVRKTHVTRMRSLLRRLFGDHPIHGTFVLNMDGGTELGRAVKIAETHTHWPWEKDGLSNLPPREQGLAAALAVADLLDEDSTRCDTDTLLHHRQDSSLGIGHWIRHSLTLHRLNVSVGRIRISLARPPDTDSAFDVVFSALRNHFRLAGLYNEALKQIGAGELHVEFVPDGESRGTEAESLKGWQSLDGLATQEALMFRILSSFAKTALLQDMSEPELEKLGARELEVVDLTLINQMKFKDGVETRSYDEQCFYALLAELPSVHEESSESGESQKASLHRLRLGMDFLRKRAFEAHWRVQGNHVNLLCALALDQASSRLTRKRNPEPVNEPLPLSDCWWALVLAVYWLVDDEVLRQVLRILERTTAQTKEEAELKQALHVLTELVAQPLYEDKDLVDSLWNTDLSWIRGSTSDESEVLLGMIIEMLFLRDMTRMDGRWRDLAIHWEKKLETVAEASDARKSLERTRTRLSVQGKIVWPGISGGDPDELLRILPDIEIELFSVWQFWPPMNWQGLDKALRKLAPLISEDSRYWSSFFRLHHATRFRRGFVGDSQGIGIMRSRIGGGFDTFRSKSLRESVEAAWGQSAQGSAHERFHAFRLASLALVDALRRWDLIAWLRAAGDLFRINLELTRHEEMRPHFAMEALWWGVLSLDLDGKDRSVQKAVGIIEIEDAKYRGMLVSALINTRPIECAKAKILFELLSDAIPEDLLTDVAQWSLKSVDSLQRGFSLELFPLSFWADILPTMGTDLAEEVCRTLGPVMDRFIKNPAAWEYDSRNKNLLTEYMRHAPLTAAVEAAQRMWEVQNVDGSANDARWTLVYNATITRQDFRDQLKEILTSTASDLNARYYAHFLEDVTASPGETQQTELRAFCRKKILNSAEHILERKSNSSIGFGGGISARLVGQVGWRDDDGDLLEMLIQVVDKPQASVHGEKAQAIQYMAQIVANGTQSLAQRLLGDLCRWLKEPPISDSSLNDWSGPLSATQFQGPGPDDIISNLAFLAAEMVARIPDGVVEGAGRWVMAQVFSGTPKTWAETVFLAMTVARYGREPFSLQMAGAANVVLARALQSTLESSEGDEHLVHVLTQIGTLMDPGNKLFNLYEVEDEQARNWFFEAVKNLIQRLVKHWNYNVRIPAARILRLWLDQGNMPAELVDTVSQFQQDARAIVRHQLKRE